MIKVLYEDYLEQKRPNLGESSKGKSEEGEDPPQIPPSPPSSLLLLLLLQVQVLKAPQRNMLINIRIKCLY